MCAACLHLLSCVDVTCVNLGCLQCTTRVCNTMSAAWFAGLYIVSAISVITPDCACLQAAMQSATDKQTQAAARAYYGIHVNAHRSGRCTFVRAAPWLRTTCAASRPPRAAAPPTTRGGAAPPARRLPRLPTLLPSFVSASAGSSASAGCG